MKVQNSPAQAAAQTYANESAKKTGGSARADKLKQIKDEKEATRTASASENPSAKSEISDKARVMASALQTAAQAPETRDVRIEELKNRIASGKYSVPSEQVAEKMISDHTDF